MRVWQAFELKPRLIPKDEKQHRCGKDIHPIRGTDLRSADTQGSLPSLKQRIMWINTHYSRIHPATCLHIKVLLRCKPKAACLAHQTLYL